MKRWLVVWEMGINRYSEVEYSAKSAKEAIEEWEKRHTTREVSSIVRIEIKEPRW